MAEPRLWEDPRLQGFSLFEPCWRRGFIQAVLLMSLSHKDGRALSIAFTVGLLQGPTRRDYRRIVAVIRERDKLASRARAKFAQAASSN